MPNADKNINASTMIIDESLFLTPKLMYDDKLSPPRDITFSLIKGDLKVF